MCSASGPGCARGGAQGPGEALALQEAATPGPAPLRGLWCRSAGQWASSTRGWAHQCPVVSPARQEGLASPCPGPSGLSTPWHQLGALGTAAPEWKVGVTGLHGCLKRCWTFMKCSVSHAHLLVPFPCHTSTGLHGSKPRPCHSPPLLFSL